MQKHSAMQQLLQRCQQIVQEPPHLAAMTVDVQLQHYEMQQKQFLSLHQEWENQFKKWQELLQTYPHKDQLHEYQVQWASWQTHMKSTKTHLKDKLTSLKNLKQQYGGSHYIGGIAMVPQYPAYPPVMPPAVPAALPSGGSIQPPYTAPVYSTGPPPSLPPTYPEATPPLPPLTAPPLPPASSAPPPPPPVSSPSAEVVQPPLPPAPVTQPSPPTASTTSETQPAQSVAIPAPLPSASSVTTTSSSGVLSAPPTMPPARIDAPITASSFIPGNNTLPTGLSYQAQQAFRNAKPPMGHSAPSLPPHNPPLDVSASSMEKQSEDPKHLNPLGPPPVPDRDLMPAVPPPPSNMKTGGPYEGPREPRFAQGHGFAPPRFPPPGPHGFYGSHPIHEREHQLWTNEPKDQSTPTDSSKQYVEVSDRMVPANRWDKPKDHADQPWERPKPPQVSEAPAKEIPEYSPGPILDRETNLPIETWKRSDGPPFNRRGNKGDDVGNKWDQPPGDRWSGSKEPSNDRWSKSQDRWNAENTSSPLERFGDSKNSGSNICESPEGAPYEKYGDGMGPQYDRNTAPETPFRDRFGHPDSSQRFRFNSADIQPRGRARFTSIPPRGRFPFPEDHPRPRFGAQEFRPPNFCYSETHLRDHFGGPELTSSKDHMGGLEQPPPQERFGGSEKPPFREHFAGHEFSSHQEDLKDPKIQPSHYRFGGSDLPERLKDTEGLSHGDHFKGPDMPPPGERFKGPAMPPPGEQLNVPAMPPPGEQFKGPAKPPPGEQFKERFKGPEMPPPPGDRFKNTEMSSSSGDHFRGPEMPPRSGGRFGVPEMPFSQQGRFGEFKDPLQDSWSHTEGKASFASTDVHSRDNRVCFNDSWGSGERKGRPEWTQGGGEGGQRPPLLGDSPLEKPEIQGNTNNAPTKSYQSQFKKKQGPDETADSRQDQQVVEMKVDEPSKEITSKAENPGVQDTSKMELSASSELHKPGESTDYNNGKIASDLPKSNLLSGQTSPLLNKANESLAASAVPSDASKAPGEMRNLSEPENTEIDSPGLSKPPFAQVSALEPAKKDAPVPTVSVAINLEELTDSSSSLGKQDAFQISSSSKTGGLLPTPTGIVAPFPPHSTQPFRPQGPHFLPPVRPGDPWAPPVRPGDPWAPPVRPGGPRAAPPFRPGGPRAAPPFRPGGPRAGPPFWPGGPREAPLFRPSGPRAPPPVQPGGPRAGPPIRPGGPRAGPLVRLGGPRAALPGRPGGPRGAPPIRHSGPRAGHPVRPGAPGVSFSAWEEPLERTVQGEDRNVYADIMCEDTYNEPDEEASHGPEGHHNRPEFPNEEVDEDGYFHHEPGRPGSFREDVSHKPEPYAEDWPENYEMRFDHRGRGRARGFMRGRLPPRPGGHEMMDALDDCGFDPREHMPEERPLFREGMNEPPPFGREPFLREPRFDRGRYSLPLEMRRKDFVLEEGGLDDWERERYWRARDLDILRDPYMRDERLPIRPPPLPHDIDVRRDPWYDRYLDKDKDRALQYDRLERPYLFERDLERDYPRIREDLDLPLRDRDWLSARRPLSPDRPFSPVRSHSPLPPLPPIDRYLNDRWRLERELADRDFRDRGELRIREYPERPLWHEDRNPDLLPERLELDPKDGRWYPPEERVGSEGLNQPPCPVDPASAAHPEQPVLPGGETGAAGVLALSQRQHEIILKAAQELKMLREQKEQLDNLKQFFGDPEQSVVQSSLEPRQPPPDIPLTGVDPASSKSSTLVSGRAVGDPFSGLWEEERRGTHSKLSGTQQTVDYAHGRDLAVGKVEHTPYGERVVLLPEPAVDRGGVLPYPKDYLLDSFDRDFRDRDPYFKNVDRRDYERDRSDTHRDRTDHEKDRDRHSREDRSSYRDKDSSSRRSTSDKTPYDRKVERGTYELPPYGGSRRSYQEERPVIPPPMSVPPPEKKPETKNVDDLLKKPGRDSRPDRIVVIMRGLPGSGKTHVAKLIRDKEVEHGGSAPRVLSLDDYFITEVEKVEKDPESGKKVKRKVMEYEYEPEMEETYRSGMLKTFKKTLDDGFFPFIILDSIHDRVRHFEQFWSSAKTKGFEVYLAEITADNQTCAKRNLHHRKLKEINKMAENWEPAPRHMIRLDIRSLLQDAAIEEVEMEDSEPSVEPQKDEKKETAEEEDNDRGYLPKSKWEMDTSEAKLDKLDGLKVNKRKRDYESVASRMEDYLLLPDDYDTRESEPGKKRVRWADLEEKKDADRKRAIGFVVGQTDWEKITDKSGHLAERALNRTKYI
uniref:YLP motif-containing protein 1 n=1 Tax=Pyxicephalus adspersus TaxID=30357 RepID=A0AAV2ZRH7_PYXAD|nr:TPA: hypothetical protein GDO54_005528 [Pyxicephalus adspersus]DBA14582.1 TPA: hypothetical protein GDO54_005528 [Pyxicephalus adspersus]